MCCEQQGRARMKASFVAFAALLLTLGLHLQSCQGKRGDCKAAPECLQRLKPMIEDLLKTSKSLNTKDDIKHKRLLPKMKKVRKQGMYGLKQMLDFYQEDVFKKHSPDSKTEEDIMNNLSRLRVDVGGCLNHPCNYSTKDAMIKQMRTTFVELKEKGVHKAFGELPRMLDWINDYVHLEEKQHKKKQKKRSK